MVIRGIAFLATCAVLLPLAATAADKDIRVSSVGYLPARAKHASIVGAATTFTIRRVEGDGVAYSGTAAAPIKDPATTEAIVVADFTALVDPGNYYLEVPGVGKSVPFSIGDDVYREPFEASMLGFYGWRCNTAVSLSFHGNSWKHDACHMEDASLDYIGTVGTKRDGLGGWHDAGDYGKYTVNAGITVGSLLAAYEEFKPLLSTYSFAIPEAGGALPDYLDEVKWELDWVLKMQYASTDGRVSHKLTSINFDPPAVTSTAQWVLPELDDQTRYYVPFGTAATADFVAMLAKAARIYREYAPAFADTCLAAAQVSYAYLNANPANVNPNQTAFKTGAYGTTDPDDRYWAAAEVWETTGDAAALKDFETRATAYGASAVDADFDWSNVRNLGTFVYLQSKRDGKSPTVVSALQASLLKAADALVSNASASGYGRAVSSYYWGSNGSVARACMLLQVANRLSPKAAYLDTCVDQLSWIFGRNYYNRSQVTGVGLDPPMNPHHRPSKGDTVAAPWPGLLVGGGNATSTQNGTNKNGATNWLDDVEAYELNEVAVNWNAPLVYALAGFLGGKALPPTPDAGTVAPDAKVTPSTGGAVGSPVTPAPLSNPRGCGCRLGGPFRGGAGLGLLAGLSLLFVRRRR